MAKEKKQEFVQHITPREENFSQWYTDVVTQTDLMDYTPVRGCMALKPYGNRIWELIHEQLDAMFQETGHENVSMPMLIPESLLLKEADHVEGFAPEVAWVTQGGTEPLQERMAVRPTSETIFCTMFSKWVQSWRDLPLKYNQWCSVMRWEKTPTASSALRLDKDVSVAMEKMEQIRRITESLPGIDCGACGSPKCRAFAEDIVAGRAEADMCVFSDKNDKDK